MTLTGGNAVGTVSLTNLQGGAIYSAAGILTLDRVHVTGNTATSGGAVGGIFFFAGSGNPVTIY